MFRKGYSRKITKPLLGLTALGWIGLAYPVPTQANQPQWAQAPIQANPAGNTLDVEEYRLAPGDRLRIDNVQGREYGGDYLIPPDGNLSLPLIGTISVLGLTIEEATDLLVSRYFRFFKNPQIGVSLLTPRAVTVSVTGEVSLPGSFTFSVQDTRFPGIQFPILTQAIEQAGGTTLMADLRNIQVRRQIGNAPEQLIPIDLWEFLTTGNPRQNITLRDGDSIIIPVAPNIQITEAQRLGLASFATDINTSRTVGIIGEVKSPGTYVVKGGATQVDRISEGLPTLTRALQLAGGITATADIRRIRLRRLSTSGAEVIYDIDLWQYLQTGEPTLDPIVQEGDTIIIPTASAISMEESRQIAQSNFAANLDTPRTVIVVGEVLSPGVYVVTGGDSVGSQSPIGSRIAGLPTVTRAIQLAGGITPDADLRRVQIRRRTRTGSEQILAVDLWQMLQTGDINQNPLVEEGDSIIIPRAININPAEASQFARANFSPNNIQIFVVGEEARPPGVQQEGRLEVPPNTPLNQALLASGALNRSRVNRKEVDLIRFELNGTVTRRTIEIDLSAAINEQNNPILRNNDVIMVDRSSLARVTDAYDTITNFLLFAPRTVSIFQLLDILGILELDNR